MEERLERAMLSEEEAEREPCSVEERLIMGDAQLRRCSERAMLSKGEAIKRAMLSEGEADKRATVKEGLKKGDAH